MKKIENVDEYIESSPKEIRSKIQELRGAIKSVAPKAEEKISYGMAYYSYFGRLIYWGYWGDHIGLYVMDMAELKKHPKEFKKYYISKATLHLPLDEKLPISLIKKIVKAQVKINESKKNNDR